MENQNYANDDMRYIELLKKESSLYVINIYKEENRCGLAEAKVVVSHYFRGIRGATRARFDFMNSMTYAEAHESLVRAFAEAAEAEE